MGPFVHVLLILYTLHSGCVCLQLIVPVQVRTAGSETSLQTDIVQAGEVGVATILFQVNQVSQDQTDQGPNCADTFQQPWRCTASGT